MITITLNQKTIKELLSLIAKDDDVDEERRDGEACVEQDGVEICVTYTVYGRWVDDYGGIDDYGNKEDTSGYFYDYTDINDIYAYANDGNDEVTILNPETITKAQL